MKNYYIDKCLELENTYLDYPFKVGDWAAIRHKDNKKIFALIYERNGKLCINFKNKPDMGYFWQSSFEAVTPAYHMNKEHWSTVYCNMDADDEDIMQMIEESWQLTKSKKREKR